MIKILSCLAVICAITACSDHAANRSPQTLHYQCGTLPLTLTQDSARQQVSFILDGQQLTLKQSPSASGTRYTDGSYSFWSKGDRAFVERQDQIIVNDCVLQSGGGK